MRINLFAGPGCGKSTLAAWLFANLKSNNYRCELISEYVKNWVYDNKVPKNWDNLYIFSKQLNKEYKILKNNIILITDSPIRLSISYMQRENYHFTNACKTICDNFDKEFPPIINILLKRTLPYQEEDRYENLQQAIQMDQIIKNNLQNYEEFDPNDKETILKRVLERIKERNESSY